MTCGHCGATVPEGEDRCRKCLRRSMLVASEPQTPQKEVSPPIALSRRSRILRAVLALAGVVLVIAVVRLFLRSLVDL